MYSLVYRPSISPMDSIHPVDSVIHSVDNCAMLVIMDLKQ